MERRVCYILPPKNSQGTTENNFTGGQLLRKIQQFGFCLLEFLNIPVNPPPHFQKQISLEKLFEGSIREAQLLYTLCRDLSSIRESCNLQLSKHEAWMEQEGTRMDQGESNRTPAQPARSAESTLGINGMTDVTVRWASYPRSNFLKLDQGMLGQKGRSVHVQMVNIVRRHSHFG